MLEFIRNKLFRCPCEERTLWWSAAVFAGALVAVRRHSAVTIVLLYVAVGLAAASFLIWAIPFGKQHWGHWLARIARAVIVTSLGCFQIFLAHQLVAEATGFHPGDYPGALAIVSVLLFVPAAVILIFFIVPLVCITGAALVGLCGIILSFFFGWKRFDTSINHVFRRVFSASMFSVLVGTPLALQSTSSHARRATKWIVASVEYHSASAHPWVQKVVVERVARAVTASVIFPEPLKVHFHENGLVTTVIKNGEAPLRFEVLIAPLAPPCDAIKLDRIGSGTR